MNTRRAFLFSFCAAPLVQSADIPANGHCANASSTGVIVPPSQPGQRLTVEGTVYRPDGMTPAAGVTMYVYHTGLDGQYGKDSTGGPLHRIWLRTDDRGRYRYDTIRPGAYPSRTIPQHVHIQFWGKDVPPQYAEELQFDDDPLVTAEMRGKSEGKGRFASVQKPAKRGNALYIAQDFKLKTTGDQFGEQTSHGLKGCR